MLRDGSFGELLVDGQRPSQWRHVFASVQSLAGLDPADLAPGTFDVVIVDEFHHAASASYERWPAHLRPSLLLGLTATPERTGGEDILHWFDGRIAAELRLWSALEQGLLCPFHYFGLHDGTDLSQIEWRRNGYASEALTNLYTADDARLRLVLRELADKVTNLDSMRALGFCVSVEHAHWMARKFVAAGLRAAALDASSHREQRAEQIRRLRCGELQILFAMVFLQTATVQRRPRHPRDRHGAVPAAHRERDRVPAAARPRAAPLPGQELPHGAGFHRSGPPELPLRPALQRPARRHPRPAGTADQGGLSLPAGRLQPAARSGVERAGAGQSARVAAHAPAAAARRSPPPQALFAGRVAGGAWDGTGGVLQGGGLLGVAAAGVGVVGGGGDHRR
ncbi:DEAD/DEAH box helicase family protein [Synechococcus sp. L2F]|nr:DEAD/DEAH box helicase family protein [Synechococcus sp. L2F]